MTTTDEARERAHKLMFPLFFSEMQDHDCSDHGITVKLVCDMLTALIASHASDLAAVRLELDEARFYHEASKHESQYQSDRVDAVRLENERLRALLVRAADHLETANEIIAEDCPGSDEDDTADEDEFITELLVAAGIETPKGEAP